MQVLKRKKFESSGIIGSNFEYIIYNKVLANSCKPRNILILRLEIKAFKLQF